MKLRALDLFCGAGGATRGLQQAGFHVTGVDLAPQPRYVGDAFNQADAMEFPLDGFDLVWASPPCQRYSQATRVNGTADEHPDLVAPIRERLRACGSVWVIENVPFARLENPILLCGSMFDPPLDVRRHRLFETSWFFLGRRECRHHMWAPRFRSLDRRLTTRLRVVGVHGHLNYPGEFEIRCRAMGIDWMKNSELVQAIPPVYAKWIGEAAKAYLSNLDMRIR